MTHRVRGASLACRSRARQPPAQQAAALCLRSTARRGGTLLACAGALPTGHTLDTLLLLLFAAVPDGQGAVHAGTRSPAGPQAAGLQGAAVVLFLRSNILSVPQVWVRQTRTHCRRRQMLLQIAQHLQPPAGVAATAQTAGAGGLQGFNALSARCSSLHCDGHVAVCVPVCAAHRFIKNNLLLELTSSKAMSAFAWLLKRHSFMSYSLYMAGATGQQQQQQQDHWPQQLRQQQFICVWCKEYAVGAPNASSLMLCCQSMLADCGLWWSQQWAGLADSPVLSSPRLPATTSPTNQPHPTFPNQAS